MDKLLFIRASFMHMGVLPPLAITFLPSGHDINFSIFRPERRRQDIAGGEAP